jgi:hypothetical protein
MLEPVSFKVNGKCADCQYLNETDDSYCSMGDKPKLSKFRSSVSSPKNSELTSCKSPRAAEEIDESQIGEEEIKGPSVEEQANIIIHMLELAVHHILRVSKQRPEEKGILSAYNERKGSLVRARKHCASFISNSFTEKQYKPIERIKFLFVVGAPPNCPQLPRLRIQSLCAGGFCEAAERLGGEL